MQKKHTIPSFIHATKAILHYHHEHETHTHEADDGGGHCTGHHHHDTKHAKTHSHTHQHGHEHAHHHHNQLEPCGQPVLANKAAAGEPILTVRAFSGLSGDMLLTGLALMNGLSKQDVAMLPAELGMQELNGSLCLEEASINGIAGFRSKVTLPEQHVHRSLKDILPIIKATRISAAAQQKATETFTLLATAEGAVHGHKPEDVTFHEVGALDSILDICLVCELFTRLAPAEFRVSPLPLADGGVRCAHGLIPTPAPAVFALLEDVQVQGFSGHGETVTPTAIALLKALGARFGTWPAMTIERRAMVYGSKVFTGAANGALWAYGPGL